MKTREQQELCLAIDEFRKEQNGDHFGKLIEALFKSPILIPQGKGERKEQFLLVHKEDKKMIPVFSDMEEVKKGSLGDVDYNFYGMEEYANIIAGIDVDGMIINIFDKNCIVAKEFFVKVVLPAFKEHRIMPGLKCSRTGEYTQINKMPFSIGRSSQADLTIEDNTVNELHGLIIEREGQYFVVDRDSLNGIYVNGNRIEKEQKIEFDDVIEFCDAEYTFVAVGLANRQAVKPTIYGDDGAMIGNSIFLMQNKVLIDEFLKKTDAYVKELDSVEGQELFRRYYFISMETTCGMREKEQNITDEGFITEQRKAMLGRGSQILKDGDYGFTAREIDGGKMYIAKFPSMVHIPGLARAMYLMTKDSGEKAVFVSRVMPDKTVKLIKVGSDNSETDYGVAPATAEEELEQVVTIGI